MKVTAIPVLTDNYIWHFTDGETNVIVDPAESEPVIDFLETHNLSLDYIIITHHHFDHVGGNEDLKKSYNCKVIGPSYDSHRIPAMDQGVSEGDEVQLGSMTAKVLFIPGHTSGHIGFWFENDGTLFCGDTLFSIGCGRLFEGTPQQMWQSLSRISSLPKETLIYCTHEYTAANLDFALSLTPKHSGLLTKQSWVQKRRNSNEPTLPIRLEEELDLNPFLRPFDTEIRSHLDMTDPKFSDEDVFARIRELKDSF